MAGLLLYYMYFENFKEHRSPYMMFEDVNGFMLYKKLQVEK